MTTTLNFKEVLEHFFFLQERGSLAIFSFNGLYDLEEYNIQTHVILKFNDLRKTSPTLD